MHRHTLPLTLISILILLAPSPAQAATPSEDRLIYMLGAAPFGRGFVPTILLDLTGVGITVEETSPGLVSATNHNQTVYLLVYFGDPGIGGQSFLELPVLLQGEGVSATPQGPYAEAWTFTLTEWPGTPGYDLDLTFELTNHGIGHAQWAGAGWLNLTADHPDGIEQHPLVFAGAGSFYGWDG